jgi:hypothetical protein
MKKLERQIYIAGLVSIPAFVILGFIFLKFIQPKMIVPCVFYMFTGFYCPGCGGTRAVMALLKGNFLLSLWYHPLVIYAVVIYVLYMASHTLAFFSPSIRGLKYRNAYLYIALGIVAVNFIVKNVLLHGFGVLM